MLLEEVKILVIDDVNTMRVQIKELLKTFGFRNIAIAGNGEEGQIALDTDRFDLVLCDWHMQPIDGLQVLKYIRSTQKMKDTAFIMVTAESTKERVVEALKSGTDDYLIKPLTPVQIQTKVYGVLLKKKVLS